MGAQEAPARPVVTLGDVTAVLELVQAHLDTTAPVPSSWEAVVDQIRAVLVERVAPLSAPGDSSPGCS
jgi:hypothetical protein